ncbi:response regulator transcription factor [Nocardioides yefusunii]|uniref:Response regulator transcription factor n=1 Tax=Nocardioides yefusunii TaxID=2500546 RepID=A0ABW1QY75_9ACTN|nr:response regulator transcription factor [Nocardioides yefusunii]
MSDTTSARPVIQKVLVYSDDRDVRDSVMLALGPHPDRSGGEVHYVNVATAAVVLDHVRAGDVDLLVLDGESAPVGGTGLAKQLRDEHPTCPPVVLLTGRPQDAWLATWSGVDAVVSHPIDPVLLARTVAGLLADPSPEVPR